MQVIFGEDEAHSLMTVIASYLIDHSGISQDGKQAVRVWRTHRAEGTPAMDGLAEAMNDAFSEYLGEVTNRTVRRKGRYQKSGEVK